MNTKKLLELVPQNKYSETEHENVAQILLNVTNDYKDTKSEDFFVYTVGMIDAEAMLCERHAYIFKCMVKEVAEDLKHREASVTEKWSLILQIVNWVKLHS